MNNYNPHLKNLLIKIERELIVTELAAWAAYHGDPFSKQDLELVLLSIRRMAALRGAINARIK